MNGSMSMAAIPMIATPAYALPGRGMTRSSTRPYARLSAGTTGDSRCCNEPGFRKKM